MLTAYSRMATEELIQTAHWDLEHNHATSGPLCPGGYVPELVKRLEEFMEIRNWKTHG